METDFNLDLDTQRYRSAEDPVSGYHLPLPQLLSGQRKHLELLAHLASYSELLVAVSGPSGSGKTVLAQALAAQREDPEESLFISADLMLGMPAILNQIARRWDMPQLSDDIVQAREAIKDIALQRYDDGLSLLVIIDQADQLDADTLNEIAHFALLAPQAISFALFGQPGFELAFRESPAQAPVHVLHLEPLTLDDAALLIQQVFSPGQPLALTQDELLFIWQQSAGWPQSLLHQAEDYLLTSANTEAPAAAATVAAQTNRFPLLHMLAIAGVAAALVVSFLYRGGDADDSVPLSQPEYVVAEPSVALPESTDTPARVPLSSFASEDDVETTEIAPPVVKTDVSEPDYNYAAPQDVNAGRQTESGGAEMAEPAIAVDNRAVTTAEPVVAAAVTPVRERSSDERALLAASGGFVVQLFGSYQADNASGFRQQWQSQVAGSLYQYRTEHNNRPWYVVVAGVYSNRDEAKAAVNALPRELRTQSPWIRDVSAVQNILR
ncbi:MAG: AAA family ATPase [Saccharospirillaceae bacterium]|nr:AAA family ATPase [Saccharospirillaceae bacterium]